MLATERRDFFAADYYPLCLPTDIRSDLACGICTLDKGHLSVLAADWHLNALCSLIPEAMHLFSRAQRYFFEGMVRVITEERKYFGALREFLVESIAEFSDSLTVDIRGQRLTYHSLKGIAYLDEQYAVDALAQCRRGATPVFISYPSLARFLDAYRNSERPVLVHIRVPEQGERCYHIVPATGVVDIFNEEEFLAKGGDLISKGIRLVVPVSEQ